MSRFVMTLCLATASAMAAHAEITRFGGFQGMAADGEMEALVQAILGMIGLHNQIPVVIDPGAPGCAYAKTATATGQHYIGVDPACVGPLRLGAHYSPRAVGILCHEIAHLLGGDTLNPAHGHREELYADEWSGWAMGKFGASLADAQTAFRTFSEAASSTHPARADRLEAVARGWAHAHADTRPSWSPPPPSSSPSPPGKPHTSQQQKQQSSWWEELMNRPLPWR
jgi:hypothetical protein